jgi:hypothetical protein
MIEKDEKYTWKTIKKYIDLLVDKKILEHLPTDNKKEHNYVMPEYLEILFTGKIDTKSSKLKK